jgi:hypothetical protein
MALITKPHTFAASAVIVASEHNSNFDTIYNDYNGNITNANCSNSMALVDTKLDEIKTANKVNITAVGSLAGLTAKTTLHNDDIFLISDSEASNARKKVAASVFKSVVPSWVVGDAGKVLNVKDGTDLQFSFPLEVVVGSYDGNNTDDTEITIGFTDTSKTPKFVMTGRANGNGAALYWTGLTAGKSMSDSTQQATSIKSVGANKFTVGTHVDVNSAATNYKFIAIG